MKKTIALCLFLAVLFSLFPVYQVAAAEATSAEESYKAFRELRDQLSDFPYSENSRDEESESLSLPAKTLTNEDSQGENDVFAHINLPETAKSTGKPNRQTSTKSSTVEANFDKLANFINKNHPTNESGYKYWINNMKAEGLTHFFVLTYIGEGILFEYMTVSGGDEPLVVLNSFFLMRNSNLINVELQLGLFSYDTLKETLTVTRSIDRASLSKDSIFLVNESTSNITANDAMVYFNTSLQLLCKYWDIQIYIKLKFGLRGLGFDSYEGRGYENPDSSEPEDTEPPEDVDFEITDPQVGVPYKWGLEQGNLGKTYYFSGEALWSGSTSEFHSKAVNVYLEAVDGGYYLYFFDKTGAKKYIVHGRMNSPNGVFPSVVIYDTPSTVYTWNSQYNTLVANMDGIDYFFGSYSKYYGFDADCALEKIDTCFPMHFYSIEGRTPEDPDTTHNYDKLADYINQVGETDEEGNRFWMEYIEWGRLTEAFSLTNTGDGIRFDYAMSYSGSETIISYSSFLMKRDSDDMATEFWVGLYYYGMCFEDITYNSSLDRSIFTTSTNCHVPLCCTFMTAEEATQLNTANIHSLCSFWDALLGETLDFGLRDLGFDIYDGFVPCPHTYDWDCDPDCNLCGKIRDISHTFRPWQKVDEESHSRICDVCQEEEIVPHSWYIVSTQLPTQDAPGVITYACDDCGASKSEELHFIPGDIDGNGTVNRDDVIALLLHVSMPAAFPLNIPADYNGDGVITRDDVIQLLLHVSMPDAFPLQ